VHWWLLLIAAVVAFGVFRQVQWRWRGRPHGDPKRVEWVVVAIQIVGVVFHVVVLGFFFLALPLLLFGEKHVSRWIAVPASIAIGAALSGLVILGVKKGVITSGPDD
jgi:hypothetical protein